MGEVDLPDTVECLGNPDKHDHHAGGRASAGREGADDHHRDGHRGTPETQILAEAEPLHHVGHQYSGKPESGQQHHGRADRQTERVLADHLRTAATSKDDHHRTLRERGYGQAQQAPDGGLRLRLHPLDVDLGIGRPSYGRACRCRADQPGAAREPRATGQASRHRRTLRRTDVGARSSVAIRIAW